MLCFDADAAGTKAAERSLASLLAEGLAVRIVEMPPGEDPDSLIRTRGAAAFLERVQGARDFFDFQLDRLTGGAGFRHGTAGGPPPSAQVAEWTSLISDSLLREAVMNRVTMRLGVSTQEFVRLLAKPRAGEPGRKRHPRPAAPLLTDPALRLLALVALHDAEARAWLLAAPWRELLAREAEAGAAGENPRGGARPRPEGTAGLSAFLTTLEPEEEATVSALLEEKPPNHPLTVATDCWNEPRAAADRAEHRQR